MAIDAPPLPDTPTAIPEPEAPQVPTCPVCLSALGWRDYAYGGTAPTMCKRCLDHARAHPPRKYVVRHTGSNRAARRAKAPAWWLGTAPTRGRHR